MDVLAALVAGVGLPLAALAAGFAWKSRDGRVRRVTGEPPSTASVARRDAADLGLGGDRLGAEATLVQFSTEFCSRCPSTAKALEDLARGYEGVRHVEVDLTRDLRSQIGSA
ncbi:hypothetical protein [Agromyces flavus]|uniref:hypothetical protein n=1 Tax=Agromyces flavus TaxID=589382 RepID=UPI00361D787B